MFRFGGLGFAGLDARCRHGTAWHAMLGRHPTYRGRWAWMLAKGQSFSAKRGGLSTDVSSGPIFLTKKKRERESLKWFLHCEPAMTMVTLKFCLQPELMGQSKATHKDGSSLNFSFIVSSRAIQAARSQSDSIKMKNSVNNQSLANLTQISRYLDTTEIFYWF